MSSFGKTMAAILFLISIITMVLLDIVLMTLLDNLSEVDNSDKLAQQAATQCIELEWEESNNQEIKEV